MIKPTIGRKIWFWNTLEQYHRAQEHSDQHNCPMRLQPEDATIVGVWTPTLVNLLVVDHDGQPRAETSVQLMQEGDTLPLSRFATWMPFQMGQAKAQKD